MNKICKTLVSVLFATLFATATYAGQGLGVGVIATSATFDTAGSELESGEITRATHSNDVDFGSIFVEYESATIGSTPISIAAGFEHTPGEAELGAKSRTDSNSEGDSATYTAKAQVSNYWSLYFEPTYNATENFGIYVKGGVSRLTVESLESIATGTDSSVYGNEDVYGGSYGFGIKGTTDVGVFFKLEYLKTEYEPVTLTSTTGNKNRIKADTEQEAARLAIGYRF